MTDRFGPKLCFVDILSGVCQFFCKESSVCVATLLPCYPCVPSRLLFLFVAVSDCISVSSKTNKQTKENPKRKKT